MAGAVAGTNTLHAGASQNLMLTSYIPTCSTSKSRIAHAFQGLAAASTQSCLPKHVFGQCCVSNAPASKCIKEWDLKERGRFYTYMPGIYQISSELSLGQYKASPSSTSGEALGRIASQKAQPLLELPKVQVECACCTIRPRMPNQLCGPVQEA